MHTRLVGVGPVMAGGPAGDQAPLHMVVEARGQVKDGPAEPIAQRRDGAARNRWMDDSGSRPRSIHRHGWDGPFQAPVSRLARRQGEPRKPTELPFARGSTRPSRDGGQSRISVGSSATRPLIR